AIDRAHGGAGFLVMETDALGALLGNDEKDVLRDRRVHDAVELPLDAALIDRGVWALRLARPAVDAFGSDDCCHCLHVSPGMSPMGVCIVSASRFQKRVARRISPRRRRTPGSLPGEPGSVVT